MMLGQRFITAVLRPLMALLLPYDVQGQENLPRHGPVAVLMNHINLLDVVTPGLFLPRDVVMLSKIENLRAPVLGLFVRMYGCLPVRRGEVDLQAMRLSLQALKKGQVLVIAPEGTRSGHGRLQTGHEGMAFVAAQANVPVVPFVTYGHERFWHNLAHLRRTPMHIRIGEPFRFALTGRRQRDELRGMTDEAMFRLAALLPPEYRGAYADAGCSLGRYTEPYQPSAAGEPA